MLREEHSLWHCSAAHVCGAMNVRGHGCEHEHGHTHVHNHEHEHEHDLIRVRNYQDVQDHCHEHDHVHEQGTNTLSSIDVTTIGKMAVEGSMGKPG